MGDGTLLKFITCGSVDDGKSTLIGHILYDAKLLYADQRQALELDSRLGSRGGEIDYSLLLDGLTAEREQGITIDVAYRYFTTEKRSFIVADTPGHEEYTRNMAVGASFADFAVILVDATKGVLIQTRRHARICALMGIQSFAFAVNKMDLAGYRQDVFESVREQIDALRTELHLKRVEIIPLSATEGDNVTAPSARMPWYQGETLLSCLETVPVGGRGGEEGFYMPVQRVCRPDVTFRGFQGQIEAGKIAVGDRVTALPSGTKARVKSLLVGDKSADSAVHGQPVTLELDREIDVSRGCVLAKGTQIYSVSRFEATLLWMDNEPLRGNRSLLVKIGTRLISGAVTEIRYVVDANTGEHRDASELRCNEIARCSLELSQPIVADAFSRHRVLGELILIDRISNATAACGVIETVFAARKSDGEEITPEIRARNLGQTPFVILAESQGAASVTERKLAERGLRATRPEVMPEQAAFAAKILQDAGLITIFSGAELSPETAEELYQATRSEWILDLRKGGPEKDRLLYENTVNYSFF